MAWYVEVKGRFSQWAVRVSKDQAEAMQADGFTIYEALNSVPKWAADIGLAPLWCTIQDIWDAPSRWTRK